MCNVYWMLLDAIYHHGMSLQGYPPSGATPNTGTHPGNIGFEGPPPPAQYGAPYPPPASAPGPAKNMDELLPELPSVPGSVVPGAASTNSQNVDFDDLTRRFEELKKRK